MSDNSFRPSNGLRKPKKTDKTPKSDISSDFDETAVQQTKADFDSSQDLRKGYVGGLTLSMNRLRVYNSNSNIVENKKKSNIL